MIGKILRTVLLIISLILLAPLAILETIPAILMCIAGKFTIRETKCAIWDYGIKANLFTSYKMLWQLIWSK